MSTLKEQAQIIRDETIPGANTANRIGNMFVNIVDEVEQKLSSGNLAQGTGSSTTNAMSQDAITKELAKRVSKDSLAQGTGTSTTTPMSQKAVTTAIDAVDKVYITSLDITTKTTGYTISAEDKKELENIRTKSADMAIYCKSNSSWYTIIYPDGDIWNPILKALVGTKIYTVTDIISPTTWKVTFVDLAAGGTEAGNGTYVTSLNIKNLSGQSNPSQISEIQNIIDAITKGQVVVFYLDLGTVNYNEAIFLSARKTGGADNRSYYLSAISTEGVIYKATANVTSDIWGEGGDTYGTWTTKKIDMTIDDTGGGVGRPGTGTSSEIFNNTANRASGNYAHAEGDNTTSSGHASHAEGQKTQATGYASHAEGGTTEPEYYTHAEGKFAHAEGNRTHAAKDASHAEGYATTANGTCSHAEGNKTTATGEDSHAEGNATNAVGLYSHAEGQNSTAKGQAAHAEGNNTKTGECETYDSNYESISTSGNNYAHAEGNNTAAGGMSSHAEGEGGIAFGRAAHAEGQSGSAVGLASHAEGELSMACGEASHAEGLYTQAGSAVLKDGEFEYKGIAAHAEGNQTKALGNHSHAEGNQTKALGNHSHAEGYGTKTTNPNEHAQGMFNVSHEHYLTDKATSFSIGIGSNEDLRKNGVEVMKNGDVYIIGIGGYDGINIESAKTVQTVISELLGN